MNKVFFLYWVGENANNVARRMRRRGFEAHVAQRRKVVIFRNGNRETALQEIRAAMRAVAPVAVQIGWSLDDDDDYTKLVYNYSGRRF